MTNRSIEKWTLRRLRVKITKDGGETPTWAMNKTGNFLEAEPDDMKRG